MNQSITRSVSGTIAADTVADVDITDWPKAPTGILNGMVVAWQTNEYDSAAHGYGNTITDLTAAVVRIIRVTCANNKMTVRIANTYAATLYYVITVTAAL
jgi:hypothetical protein